MKRRICSKSSGMAKTRWAAEGSVGRLEGGGEWAGDVGSGRVHDFNNSWGRLSMFLACSLGSAAV